MTVEAPPRFAYTAERPLLLLTDYPPDAAGGGAVILRNLLEPAERGATVWISPSPASSEVAGGRFLASGSAGRRGRRSLWLDSTLYASALAGEVERIARETNAPAAWIVMHGAGVAVAAKLARRGVLPLHLTVHDDPAFANALRSRRYLPLVPWIERDFADALRRAKSVDVICDAMRERYRKRYGVDSVVVHRGLREPVRPSPAYDGKTLRVGVLGSTYSYEQLPILGRAVASAAGSLGVPGEIVVLGRSYGERLRDEMGDAVRVEPTGHVDEESAIPILQGCFALYLNYPFGRRDAVLRQTSFPTKLSTYVQAARPLVLHVPADSSVTHLVELDGYAAHWGSNLESDGAAALIRLWNDPANHKDRQVEAESVRRRHYDRATNRASLFQALGVLVP